MNYDYPQTDLSRSLLAGVFAGIIATFANIIFIAVFRYFTKFFEFNIMDVSTAIFGTMLLLITCGIFFYFFAHYLKQGINLYRVVVFLITGVIVYAAMRINPPGNVTVPSQFRFLFIGTQLIIGGLAAFLIPYLFRHDKVIS